MKPLSILIWVLVSLAGAGAFAAMALGRGEQVSAAWLLTAALCTYAVAYRFYSKIIAAKVFAHTSGYDGAIAGYLAAGADDALPRYLPLALRRMMPLRYGENPGQRAALYLTGEGGGVADLKSRKISVASVAFDDGTLRLSRGADGALSPLGLLRRRPQTTASTAAPARPPRRSVTKSGRFPDKAWPSASPTGCAPWKARACGASWSWARTRS